MSTTTDLRFRGHKAYHKAAPIVLDLGTRYTRIGIAGEPHPRHTLPTPSSLSYLTPHPPSFPSSSLPSHYHRHLLPYLRHLYSACLLLQPRDRRLLILEPPYLPLPYKLALLSSLSSLHCPAVFFLSSFIAAAALSPSPSVTVVDLGYSDCRVCAVVDLTVPCLPHLLTSSDSSLSSLSSHLASLTSSHPPNAALLPRLQAEVTPALWDDLASRVVYLDTSPDDGLDAPYTFHSPSPSYVDYPASAFLSSSLSPLDLLPPAQSPPAALTVVVPGSARRACALAALFPPHAPLDGLIRRHVASLPIDLRRRVSDVILVGGGSHIPGLGAYLQGRLDSVGGREGLGAGTAGSRLRVVAVEGGEAVWRGGSIMGGVLGEGEDGWIGEEDMRAYVAGKGMGGKRVEMEDWLWPLGQRAAPTAKESALSASVFVPVAVGAESTVAGAATSVAGEGGGGSTQGVSGEGDDGDGEVY